MRTISDTKDLADYIAETRANYSARERAFIVALLRASDHPAWGEDWEAWLAEEAEQAAELCDVEFPS